MTKSARQSAAQIRELASSIVKQEVEESRKRFTVRSGIKGGDFL
jgi:hypothetical protein